MQKYFTWKVKKIKEVIENTIKDKRLNEGSKENRKNEILIILGSLKCKDL